MLSVINLSELKAARRETVRTSYIAAEAGNRIRFLERDPRATEQYIWENQKIDANRIVEILTTPTQINEGAESTFVSLLGITKEPQLGMTGLLHYIPYLFCTHPDDDIVVDPKNVCILTAMNNVEWENETKDDFPLCFRDQIFHHGKLNYALPILQKIAQEGGLLLIDEIQNGAQANQVLHQVLRESGLLNIQVLESKKVKIITASATMIKHIHQASHWGGKFVCYKMIIPPNYLSFKKLKEQGVLKQWKNMNTLEETNKWFDEVVEYYTDEYRVHLTRANPKMLGHINQCAFDRGFGIIPHTSKEKLTPAQKQRLFHEPLTQHWIIPVKALWRAANRIPTSYKLRIGAVHEQWVKNVDNDVQAQGLPGRMLGFNNYPAGHKIGPYYTSLSAIDQYIAYAADPLRPENAYQCARYKRSADGVVRCGEKSIVSITLIANLEPTAGIRNPLFTTDSKKFAVFSNAVHAKEYAQMLDYHWNEEVITQTLPESNGFIVVGLNGPRQVHTIYEVLNKVPTAYGGAESHGNLAYRTCLVGYKNIEDINTALFVVVIRPDDYGNEARMAGINSRFVGRRITLDKYQIGIMSYL